MSTTKDTCPGGGERQRSPLYLQVKDYVLERISRGQWKAGRRIPSENQLVELLGVSRMTVNRALRELSSEGHLVRTAGVGTFVAPQRPLSPLLNIQSIAQEINDRGGRYSCQVHLLAEEPAQPSLALAMGLKAYSPVFHSIIVHFDDDIPIQLGDRYVNPAIAPDYLQQDFTQISPSDYLLGIAPVSELEHVVEAIIAPAWARELLEINEAEPCLLLHRRTWVETVIATSVRLFYPGSRYALGGRFRPPGSDGLHIT